MKILLTVPIYPFRSSHPPLPDLGLGYLAAAVRNAGHEVLVHDWNKRTGAHAYSRELQSFKPDVVGLKFFTLNVAAAQQTASIIQQSLGDKTLIVLGGPHPSGEELRWLAHDFPQAHGRFVGEAETSLVALLEYIQQGASVVRQQPHIKHMPAVSGFDLFSESAHDHDHPSVIADLDTLIPPAWDLIDPRTYTVFSLDGRTRVLAPLMVTRGCPLDCKFCATAKISGKTIRRHSPEVHPGSNPLFTEILFSFCIQFSGHQLHD